MVFEAVLERTSSVTNKLRKTDTFSGRASPQLCRPNPQTMHPMTPSARSRIRPDHGQTLATTQFARTTAQARITRTLPQPVPPLWGLKIFSASTSGLGPMRKSIFPPTGALTPKLQKVPVFAPSDPPGLGGNKYFLNLLGPSPTPVRRARAPRQGCDPSHTPPEPRKARPSRRRSHHAEDKRHRPGQNTGSNAHDATGQTST